MRNACQSRVRRSSARAMMLVGLTWALVAGSAGAGFAVELIAHWRLNESGAPFADSGLRNISLTLDAGTASAVSGPGIESLAAETRFDNPPGVSTRLSASSEALQSDSFGFSFWIRPDQVNPGDNLIAKEMSYTNGIPDYARVAWKVSLLGDVGGLAPVEFIVRGANRAQGDFFGSASSAAAVPLYGVSSNWIHIAGGYDVLTGALTLYVNGMKTVSANSSSGADNSDGSPFSIGSIRNGSDYVGFAATAYMEDVQIYDGPLSDSDVAALMANPGATVETDFSILDSSLDRNSGNVSVGFESHSGADYRIDVSTSLAAFVEATNFVSDIPLAHDGGTVAPEIGAGVEGDSPRMSWQESGTATRLYADDGALQTDSFGFSFWIKPVNINPFDNLIAKEMAFDNSVPLYSRMSWQVSLLDNNGSNAAPVQLIVRGDSRASGDFFGTATSAATVPLYGALARWIHVAGGYDAVTGAMRLFVDGQESVSGNSSPGAHNSDGSPFAIGSARNGADFVAFAGNAFIDDVRIYDRPLTAADVTSLMACPGQAGADTPHLVARWVMNGPEAPFEDSGGGPNISTVTLSETLLDAVLGAGSRSLLYLRIAREVAP